MCAMNVSLATLLESRHENPPSESSPTGIGWHSLSHYRQNPGSFSSFNSSPNPSELYFTSNELHFDKTLADLRRYPKEGDTHCGVSGIQNLSFVAARPHISRIVMFDPNESTGYFWRLVINQIKENPNPTTAKDAIIAEITEKFPLDAFRLPETAFAAFIEDISAPTSPFEHPEQYRHIRDIILNNRFHIVCVNLGDLSSVVTLGKILKKSCARIDTLNISNIHFKHWLGLDNTLMAVNTLIKYSNAGAPILITANRHTFCHRSQCTMFLEMTTLRRTFYGRIDIPIAKHLTEAEHVGALLFAIEFYMLQIVQVNRNLSFKVVLPSLGKHLEDSMKAARTFKHLVRPSMFEGIESITRTFHLYIRNHSERQLGGRKVRPGDETDDMWLQRLIREQHLLDAKTYDRIQSFQRDPFYRRMIQMYISPARHIFEASQVCNTISAITDRPKYPLTATHRTVKHIPASASHKTRLPLSATGSRMFSQLQAAKFPKVDTDTSHYKFSHTRGTHGLPHQ